MTTQLHAASDLDFSDLLRARLLDVVEATRGCAIACAVAADGAQARGDAALAHQLSTCAVLTEETGLEVARLSIPDVAPLSTLLAACRAACALAQRVGSAQRDDVVLRRALAECSRCEDSCARVLEAPALAA